MKIVADIHLHSYYSRATSKTLNLEHLYKWAQLKGVQVVGTGDIAHPGWLSEMRQKLQPAEDGLFRLKKEISEALDREIFPACRGEVRFMLAGEISNIYKKNDKVRKIHNVVFMPSFESTERFQAKLEQIGNIRSDGRPILGLDARDLLEIVLETDPAAHFIPAHIWTPWFSLLGSMSGFDSVEECFEDLTPHIFAVETGLSSDPPMNWRLSQLDRYTLVSNSDAHSPQKLAREANLFNTELSYDALFSALKSGDKTKFLGTIEFFPEEGKYHFDGHRKCGIRWDPKVTLEHGAICPECGRPVTVGVMHRVEVLADREPAEMPQHRHPYRSLVPLPEILAEIYDVGVNTKKVRNSFEYLLRHLGSELDILRTIPLADLEKLGGSLLSEGIRRMRAGELQIDAGYDGEFGVIRLFRDSEREDFTGQLVFFQDQVAAAQTPARVADASGTAFKKKSKKPAVSTKTVERKTPGAFLPVPPDLPEKRSNPILAGLNELQVQAVTSPAQHILVSAGPGTGKTKTLAHRIAYLLTSQNVAPESILAITFTNKAAEELLARLRQFPDLEHMTAVLVKTFHAFAANLLMQHGHLLGLPSPLTICTDDERKNILQRVAPELSASDIAQALEDIARLKNQTADPGDAGKMSSVPWLANYQRELIKNGKVDFDDLIFYANRLLAENPEIRTIYTSRFKWLFIDEYQDINAAQYQLLQYLRTGLTRVYAIGDPDQAIYGFRGADRKYFLHFKRDFKDAKFIFLQQSYRSTKTILQASRQVIASSSDLKPGLWSNIDSPLKLCIHRAATDKAEAEYVVHQIEKMVGGTSYFSMDSGRLKETEYDKPELSFADFAVLYRLHEQSRCLAEAFERSGIPFQVAGQKSFFDHKDVQRMLDFLWFVHQPDANEHLENILQHSVSGIGPATVEKLTTVATAKHISLWELLSGKLNAVDLPPGQLKKVEQAVRHLSELWRDSHSKPIVSILEQAQGLFHALPMTERNSGTPNTVKRFILRAKLYDTHLLDFLESSIAADISDTRPDKSDHVRLMTLHASKGLEFPVVFICGCEEGILPYTRAVDVDEERRLTFVGMTRAKFKLHLTSARTRFLHGERMHNPPSRFIADIENALKEEDKSEWTPSAKPSSEDPQLSLF